MVIIWKQGKERFNKYAKTLNSARHTITFTVHNSTRSVKFLNATVILKHSKLSTTLYKEPTGTQQYLHCPSHHLCKVAVPSSQSIKLRRIYSDNLNYSHKVDERCQTPSQRNYLDSLLDEFHRKDLTLSHRDAVEL